MCETRGAGPVVHSWRHVSGSEYSDTLSSLIDLGVLHHNKVRPKNVVSASEVITGVQ